MEPEFSDFYFNNQETVEVSVEWLMKNAVDSVDFGYGFSLTEMLETKTYDTGFGHLVESIMEHGFRRDCPIGFDPDDGMITEGHHRFCAAILLCLDTVYISMYGGDDLWSSPERVNSHCNYVDPYPIAV